MQFVYICRSGGNEELRYSIRSVQKFFPGSDIVVVGNPPEWYGGTKITVPQTRGKYENAKNNIIKICNSDLIENPFVFMNDDFFIIKEIGEIPYLYSGLLSEKLKLYAETSPNNPYTKRIAQTYKKIKDLGISNPLDYELHVPFLAEKDKLKISVKHDYLWRSVYGNLFSVGGTQVCDVKIYSEKEKNPRSFPYKEMPSPFISSDDRSFLEIKENVLSKILSTPSSLEQ
jgi:hypothetical protein